MTDNEATQQVQLGTKLNVSSIAYNGVRIMGDPCQKCGHTDRIYSRGTALCWHCGSEVLPTPKAPDNNTGVTKLNQIACPAECDDGVEWSSGGAEVCRECEGSGTFYANPKVSEGNAEPLIDVLEKELARFAVFRCNVALEDAVYLEEAHKISRAVRKTEGNAEPVSLVDVSDKSGETIDVCHIVLKAAKVPYVD